MQAVEIKDKESLEAWLQARPEATRQRDAVTIAHRAAMRVLPIVLTVLEDWRAQKQGWSALYSLRANIVACATTHGNRSDFITAANAAMNSKANRPIFTYDKQDLISVDHGSAIGALSTVWVNDSDDAIQRATYGVVSALDTILSRFQDAHINMSTTLWLPVQKDALAIDAGLPTTQAQLWPPLRVGDGSLVGDPWIIAGQPTWFGPEWQIAKQYLQDQGVYDFWIRWYEAALAGRPLTGDWNTHTQLLTEIALIPDEDWERGAEHIAELIEALEQKYQSNREVRFQPAQINVSVGDVQRAMQVNRFILPPTFDAIYGYIEIEIYRLQGINAWESNAQCEEARSLIRRLTALAQAVQDLKETVENAGVQVSVADAEKAKSLLELYGGLFKSWPRDNASDIVDSVWRIGLTGLGYMGATLLGVPPAPAMAFFGAVFGGKKLADALKAGTDSKSVISG